MNVIDPVCNMAIEDKDAVAASDYKGTTYYSALCLVKKISIRDPESYLMPCSYIKD